MAFSAVPSTWLGAGYAYSTNQITLNTAAHASALLTELTAADADATTGDIREIFYALCDMMYTKWEAQPDADQPTQVTVSRNQNLLADGTLRRQFSFSFDLDVTVGDVASES